MDTASSKLEVISIFELKTHSALHLPLWSKDLYDPFRGEKGFVSGPEWFFPSLFPWLCEIPHRAHRKLEGVDREIEGLGCEASLRVAQLYSPVGGLLLADGTIHGPAWEEGGLWLLAHFDLPFEGHDQMAANATFLAKCAQPFGVLDASLASLLATCLNREREDLAVTPNGCFIHATGDRFHKPLPGIVDFSLHGSPGTPWGPEAQWLWWLSECVETNRRRDPPASIEDQIFDFKGSDAYVGRNAAVVVDCPNRTASGTASTGWVAAQPDLADEFPVPTPKAGRVRNQQLDVHACNALLLATYQRNRLYHFSDLLICQSGGSKPLEQLKRELFDFRQRFWWIHLDSNPASSDLLKAYHHAHRLPLLMEQLVNETRDYVDALELGESHRLNTLVKLLTVLLVAVGATQIYDSYRITPVLLASTIFVFVISVGVLLVIASGIGRFHPSLRRMRKPRVPKSGQPRRREGGEG